MSLKWRKYEKQLPILKDTLIERKLKTFKSKTLLKMKNLGKNLLMEDVKTIVIEKRDMGEKIMSKIIIIFWY